LACVKNDTEINQVASPWNRQADMAEEDEMKSSVFVGAALVALGLSGLAVAALAGIGNFPGEPDADVIAIDGCEHCAGLIASGETDLVITTTLADGDYVAVWKSKLGSGVSGQIYTRDGRPRGAQFRIHADVEEDYLPIVHLQPNGEFVARWKRAGATYERRFDSFGIPLGAEARLK
jgi:hypothetical protein